MHAVVLPHVNLNIKHNEMITATQSNNEIEPIEARTNKSANQITPSPVYDFDS